MPPSHGSVQIDASHKRIMFLRRMAGLTREEFAKAIGYSKSSVVKWETPEDQDRLNHRGVPKKAADKIAEAFGARSAWIITGDGEPYQEGKAPVPKLERPNLAAAAKDAESGLGVFEKLLENRNRALIANPQGGKTRTHLDHVLIPVYALSASAGPGTAIPEQEPLIDLAFPGDWIRAASTQPGKLAAVRVDGDSMEPVLQDGETVLFDTSPDRLRGDGIFLFRMDGALFVKRLVRMGKSIQVISENPKFPPYTITPGEGLDFEVIGKAVWTARRL